MIHKFKFAKQNFVLDVNTSCLHLFDDLAYELVDADEQKQLELLSKYSKKEIDECYKEIQKLKDENRLFSKSNDAKLAEFNKCLPIKSMCLNISHDCNLRCKYCFASTGNFKGERMLMPFEVGKAAIDFLVKNSKTRHNLEVDFFGGEPLMNFEVVKKIVEYARSTEKYHNKNFRFTITTNGMLLDEDKIDFINKQMHSVVLSLDGRKNVNDDVRLTLNKEGTYEKILPLYKKLIAKREKNKNYYIRGTFTNKNLDFAKDVLHINNLGFKNISIEPVVLKETNPYSIKEENLEVIGKEYEKLVHLMLNENKERTWQNNLVFFHLMIDLDGGPCAIKRVRGCSCANEYVAITPTGDIYPCHQFVSEDRWKMGNILENTFDEQIKKIFSKININTKEDCKNCFAKYHCSGGCHANAWIYEKDLLKTHAISCKIQRKRLECAFALEALKRMKSLVCF